jgi:hypothetical protein
MKNLNLRRAPPCHQKEQNMEVKDQEGGNKSDVSPKGNDSIHQSNNDDSSSSDDSDKGSLGQHG